VVNMFRLIGLLTCVSLAFIFPMYAYNLTETVIIHFVSGTLSSCILTTVLLKE